MDCLSVDFFAADLPRFIDKKSLSTYSDLLHLDTTCSIVYFYSTKAKIIF